MTQNIYDDPKFSHAYSQMAEVEAQPALAEERERPMMMLVSVKR